MRKCESSLIQNASLLQNAAEQLVLITSMKQKEEMQKDRKKKKRGRETDTSTKSRNSALFRYRLQVYSISGNHNTSILLLSCKLFGWQY